MTEKIFLLPADDVLSALDARTRAEYAARLIEAVPDDWSDATGVLEHPDRDTAQDVVWDTGYMFQRFDPSVRIAARRKWVARGELTEVVRPDPVALVIEGKSPGFVSFEETGFDAHWQLSAARAIAAGFVRRGYIGWIEFNNGKRREYAHEKPAEVEIRLGSWSMIVDTPAPRRLMPPAVVLRWEECYGGSLAQLEPICAVCRLACQELTL